MVRRLVFLVLILGISVVSASADIHLHVGTGQAVLLAQDIRFDPALQLASSLGAGFAVTITPWLEIGAGGAIERVMPSALTAGYQYRGVTARTLLAEVSVFSPGAVSWGGRVAASASLAGYDGTFLLFFYPSLSAGVLIRAPLSLAPALPLVSTEWSFWVGYDFRQDLDRSMRMGIGGRICVEFPRLVK